MAKRDYYEVLGVQKGASADDIKRKYRQLAIKYLDADTDVVSTKTDLEAEIPTFTQATAMMEDDV